MNSDEPQHLHVAWVVAHGGIQYHDVFDNHSPLFSLAMAPIVRAIGERPDIVVLSRLVMIPLVLTSLALVWLIGARLYSKRVGLWAAAATLVVPDFALASVEYRTDQLWTTAWMATLAALFLGRATPRRALLCGIFLGVSFCASMKTSMLAVSLALGWVAAALLARGGGLSSHRLARLTLAGLGGTILVPGVVAAHFASKGAFQDLAYGTIAHNVVPGLGSWGRASTRILLLPLLLPPLLWIARRVVAAAPDSGTGVRRGALFLGAGIYYAAIQAAWPLITRQDFLPFIPMAAIVTMPFLLGLVESARSRQPLAPLHWLGRHASSFALILAIAKTQSVERPWAENDVGVQAAFLSEVLRMTRPTDPVMDVKGETIFRARPYFYALESVTCARIERGTLRDSIAERLVATRTPVAVLDTHEFPKRGRAFLRANYIRAGSLRYVGAELGPPDGNGMRRFEIRVPQQYALVSDRESVSGSLDGTEYGGPRELAAGAHVFRGTPAAGRIDALWAEAVRRGAGPFP